MKNPTFASNRAEEEAPSNCFSELSKRIVSKQRDLSRLIIIGDRILVRPTEGGEQTDSGLFLPPSVVEKEKVRKGYVMKVGPGYPIPMPFDNVEPWEDQRDKVKYIPLQARPGDLALFLQKDAIEVQYQQEKYFIVAQQSILMLERDDELFD